MKRFVSSVGVADRPSMAIAMILALLALALQFALPSALIEEAQANSLAAPPLTSWNSPFLCRAHDGSSPSPDSDADARHAVLHHGLCLLCQAAAGGTLLTVLPVPALLPPGDMREIPVRTVPPRLRPALRPKASARGPPGRPAALA